VRRVSIVEPTVDQTQPSTDVRRPTLDASPAAQDPVRPRLYTKPAMTPEANTDNVILEEPWRQ
jgi:hypothetical protein